MKWNVKKISPIIDAIVSLSIVLALFWVLPNDWFVGSRSINYPDLLIAMMITYHLGLWSGRRFEQKKRGRR